MIRVRPEQFPPEIGARSTGPFKVLKRLGPNAYVLDLPPDMGISSTFNVEDLAPFRGPTTPPDIPSPIVHLAKLLIHLSPKALFHNLPHPHLLNIKGKICGR